jgi:hypothetical protein
MSLDALPDELVIEIAEHLTSMYSHGSLASLSQTSRHFRDVTTPTLYRTLILFETEHRILQETSVYAFTAEGERMPDGWRHTR